MERYARFLLIFIIAWQLLGCQKPAVKPEMNPFLVGPDGLSTQAVQEQLAKAESASEEEQLAILLNVIEALISAQQYDWARNVAESFPVDQLSTLPSHAVEHGRWALLNAHLDAVAGNTGRALQAVSTQALMDALAFYPEALERSIREIRAELLFDIGDFTNAVNERIILTPGFTGDEAAHLNNQELLWQALMEMPLAELEDHVQQSKTRAHKGWYSLAVISKNNQNNMRGQVAQLDEWQRQWPEHPASLMLPADLQLLRELVANQPKHIALLLPESGRFKTAAQAIQDGLLSAYYHYQTLDPEAPSIRFYDSEQGDIQTIYQQAIDEGAELIIGPLSKDKIVELSSQLSLPVPTLALNTVDNPLGYIENLYQFGLAVEDEAKQAAQKAWRDGHRRLLIIAPNSLWGDRCTNAFTREWQKLGGDYQYDYRFDEKNDYSTIIKRAMHIDQSIERAKRLRSLVGKIEFEPRRRQDVDAIFVAASASQARQIKPTLAFHYAGDLPVYATSNIYEGVANRKLDQDMNGIMFSTLPWFFNNQLPEKTQLMQSANVNLKLQPLYALGVDSFYLYPRLPQLKMIEGARFYGQTGALQLTPAGQIERKQTWAEFANGKAKHLKNLD